jgi:SAM-dependent methyltransferase
VVWVWRTDHRRGITAWWGEFNDDFRPHEIPFYQAHIERSGQPVLDAGCGAGRLLLPYLRAGPDVDGCDQSADMIEVCREKVAIEGFEPNLYVQAMHAIDLPRMYRTILVVGSFGLGSHRERDMQALVRMREHLEPGGTVLIDIEVPYADPGHWEYWLKDKRVSLPETEEVPHPRRRTSDGSEYAMSARLVAVEPLDQRVTMEAHIQRWRDGTLEAEEQYQLDIGMYFKSEMLMMLEQAGFANVAMYGEHQDRPPTSDDDFIVFAAKV